MHLAPTASPIARAAATQAMMGAQFVFGASNDLASRACHPERSEGSRFEPGFFASAQNDTLGRSAVIRGVFEIDQGSLGTARFLRSASDAISLSPISDDDNTSSSGAGAPPPGGAGSGSGGGGSGDPKAKLAASLVFDALVRLGDPQNHNVLLTEAGLADALLEHGLIEWKSNEDREAMKAVAKTLEGFEETLRNVEKAIEDRKSEQALLSKSINSIPNRILSSFFEKIGFLSSFIKKIGFLSSSFEKIGSFLSSFFEKIGFLSSFFKKIGSPSSFSKKFREKREAKRRQYKDIGKEIENLKKNRRTLANKVERKKINDEWLGRMKRADYYNRYVYLTPKGRQVLERMEGDRKLEYLTFEDYMRLYGSEDGV